MDVVVVNGNYVGKLGRLNVWKTYQLANVTLLDPRITVDIPREHLQRRVDFTTDAGKRFEYTGKDKFHQGKWGTVLDRYSSLPLTEFLCLFDDESQEARWHLKHKSVCICEDID